MYHLCIDSGNSNTVFAVFEGDKLLASWRITTESQRTADEYAVWLQQLMQLKNIDHAKVRGAIIANVVPQTQYALDKLCENYFQSKPLVIGQPSIELGLRVLVDSPEEVGADRLVNAVAVRQKYDLPAVVVDFGTATTFDLVDGKGNYLGGVICPGINLSLNALISATAMLPRITFSKPKKVVGKNTVAAMQSGLYWGYIGMIEGVMSRMEKEFGQKLPVVATGGLARFFSGAIPNLHAVDQELTLYGLSHIYKQNSASKIKRIRSA